MTRADLFLPPKTSPKKITLAPMRTPPVLDACCGSRMFWFDRQDSRAVFADKRRETHLLPDKSSTGGSRMLTVNPDVLADFTALPWEDNTFAMVVFDPPHLVRAGKKGWQAKKYGKLEGDWRETLRRGFAECFRVLRPEGTLIFKWNEHEVPVSQILALTPARPLVGQRCGKSAKTHWIVFMKSLHGAQEPAAYGNHLSYSGNSSLRIRQPSDSTGLSLAGVRVAIPETPCLHCQKPGATEKAFNLNGLLCGECHSEEIRIG